MQFPPTITSSSEWHKNGAKSIKLTCEHTNSFCRFKYQLNPEDIGKRLTIGLSVYSTHAGSVFFNAFNSSNTVLMNRSITYSKDNGADILFSEITIVEGWSWIALTINFSQSSDAIRYIDNCLLYIQ
ncbi:MAG: hypothetical protein IJN90_08260 [Bacilli bacterium]|nr:hypothetical protein [Methanosphaera sp.]MBQ7105834.1 hypothetical protein [Bacilli bacterium]MBQ7277244.1 hypothetical protein [Bacilli bacterium]